MDVNAHAGTDGILDGQPAPQDLDGVEGQSAGEPNVDGQLDPGVQDSSTTTNTPVDLEQLQKDYKALQTDYGKRNESYKEMETRMQGLDQFGGVEQMQQWAQYLSDNPRFARWVQEEQTREHDSNLGLDGEEIDDDTRRALDLVRKEAELIADQRIKQAMKEQVDPIAAQYKEQLLTENLSKMDETYDNWRDVQDKMAELANDLPPDMQDSPTFETLDDLYWKAMRVTGKMDGYAASQYEKQLRERKAHSTEKPATSSASTGNKKAETMTEAYQQTIASQNR